MSYRLSLIAAIVCLSACSESPRDAVAPTAAATASSPAANAEEMAKNVIFTSNPASIRSCETTDGNATASLSWDVRPASISFVTIKVGDQVFAEGNSTGTSTTGNWVRADTVFTLFDAGSLKPLATLQIPFVDCRS